MYSVVLMAALTTGTVAPDCHRCGGCCGCYGGGYGYGYGCGGCYGGCYGCFGGCYGGCWGGGGGCYGCWGGYSSWGCMGCMGCYGGGYGMGMGGGYGAPTWPGNVIDGGMYGPGGTAPQGEGLPKPAEDGKKKNTMLPTKAKLVVELPENAKLFIDDLPMKNTAKVRSFNTPSLEPGQAYYYMVRVESERDGKPVSETRRVVIRAGQTARADFTDLTTDTVRTAKAK